MHRRHFLSLLGAAPVAARSYFDIGAAWQKHNGVWAPKWDGDIISTHIDGQLVYGAMWSAERNAWIGAFPIAFALNADGTLSGGFTAIDD